MSIIQVVTAPETDWNKIKNHMTYKEAMQDFGFNKNRATYEVEVQVAGNESANDNDGDTGSTNLFYFQLLFKGGSSAYVLANQQLTADGFRAGELETFTISTNQDYGDLTAIRILPDGLCFVVSDPSNNKLLYMTKIIDSTRHGIDIFADLIAEDDGDRGIAGNFYLWINHLQLVLNSQISR